MTSFSSIRKTSNSSYGREAGCFTRRNMSWPRSGSNRQLPLMLISPPRCERSGLHLCLPGRLQPGLDRHAAHYVELLPNEPNPQDSYAEILRMAGRYDDALEHYRPALHIDPNFHSSQIGIADTDTLMGQQKRAQRIFQRKGVGDRQGYRTARLCPIGI